MNLIQMLRRGRKIQFIGLTGLIVFTGLRALEFRGVRGDRVQGLRVEG